MNPMANKVMKLFFSSLSCFVSASDDEQTVEVSCKFSPIWWVQYLSLSVKFGPIGFIFD